MAWPPTTHQDVQDEITAIRAAWTAYTPTFDATTTSPTLANFTRAGRYIQIGKTVHFVAVIACNATTGLGSGTYTFGLPVTARTSTAAPFAGDEVVVMGNQHGPNRNYIGRGAGSAPVDNVSLWLTSTDAQATSTSVGFTTGTVLRISGSYEAA